MGVSSEQSVRVKPKTIKVTRDPMSDYLLKSQF